MRAKNSFKLFVEEDPFKDVFVDCAASQCFDRGIFGL